MFDMIALFMAPPGAGEVLIVLAIILLLFGAKRLPELSRSLGKSLGEFKKGREEGMQEEGKEKQQQAAAASDPKPLQESKNGENKE
jgi:sec-independent protein translocase protein TatA